MRTRALLIDTRNLVVSAMVAILFLPGVVLAVDGPATYRCWVFNVGGRAGRCQSAPPIVLNPDGTYQESSTRGRYTIQSDEIVFSGSTTRGPGRIKDNTIVFEYVYNNLPHTVTYLLASGGAPASQASATGTSPKGAAQRVGVKVLIHFPPSDGSVAWLTAVILVPEGEGAELRRTAIMTDRTSVTATFDGPLSSVRTGHIYGVYVSNGRGVDKRRVGRIDLRDVTQDVSFRLDAEPSQSATPPRQNASPAPPVGPSSR